MKKTISLIKTSFVCLITAFLFACSSVNLEPPKMNADLVWATHDERPEWLVVPPENDSDIKEFVGVSFRHATEKTAREVSYSNAIVEILKHARQEASKDFTQEVNSSGNESSTLDADVKITDINKIKADGLLKDIKTKEIYVEQWKGGNDMFFKAYTLVSIPQENYEILSSR